ncbi:hypothetical protein [Brevibacillus centrosporus]|uniref:Uncharacterized protein n=1 Tax=Brevibacillus centrosporus TaxID=54910 RepID=A0A1I3ZYA4_9BACL|nr:hypothetical protein [Brevibacillus centrosporus]MEC2131783.1 hypothetical protein [Brevibacillus centrosporus]MED4908495.1 hypothetical protein [Brevibacillus centrosporus]RNB67426.1 hypothetical protein EDM55_20500 [Brevibacillus centrosporus]SFK48626.1 hypothetical protein SAMN05518846_11440 [Brevibacillus centrosporus]GED33604.1 hypothetical protein BCE02nite_47450 [Brevibacillus centrosporus]
MKLTYKFWLLFIIITCFAFLMFPVFKVTEEQAIQMVKDEYEDVHYGPIIISSVNQKGAYYEIKWTRESNCEGGTVKIHILTRQLEAEHRIC